MVSRTTPLTPIGFRRELFIFLSMVVGFLVVIVLVLLMLLQFTSARYEEQTIARWDALSDAAAERIRSAGEADLRSWPTYLRSTYGAEAAEIRVIGGSAFRDGEVVEGMEAFERRAGGAVITLWFDASELRDSQRVFRLTAAVCFAGTLAATLLLALFLPRIVRPFERMLESARSIDPNPTGDEAVYLVETFRRTIETLRDQEQELQRLHALEKSRADELERIVQTLKRSIASGFLAISPEGNVVEINDAGRRILGIDPRADINGRALEVSLPDGSLAAMLLEALEEQRSIQRQEVEVVTVGRVATIGLTQVPLLDANDRFLGAITLFTDLTQVRSLEVRLREVQTLADLGQITAGIAHEFRNSLSTIRGYLRMAAGDAASRRSGERLAAADREAAELSSAVDRLLTFARPMEPEWEPVDLVGVTAAVIERLAASEPAAGFEIEGDEEAWIEGDRVLLARAIENLLRNAIEAQQMAGRPGEAVRIGIHGGEAPRIEIADRGVGLQPGDAERIILPFQSGKPGGWGLGLPLARRILLLHGAEFSIAGEPGAGVRVEARFSGNATPSETPDVTQKPPPSS